MNALRDLLADQFNVLYDTLELTSCGFYLRSLSEQSTTENPGFDRILVSNKCLTSLGYTSIRPEWSLDEWLDLCHPDDREQTFRHHQSSLHPGDADTQTLIFRLRRADDSYRYTRETLRRIKTSANCVGCWLGVLEDIDEQTKAKQRLAAKAHEMQVILDTIPTYIWFKDLNDRILKCNRAAAEASGMTVEEVEGRLTSEVYPDSADHFARSDQGLKQLGTSLKNLTEHMVSTNGQRRLIKVDKYQIQLSPDSESRILVVGSDITEMELTRQALTQSESQFRELFDRIPLGILLVQQDGKIQLANPAAEQMFKHPHGSLFNRCLMELVPQAMDRFAHFQTKDPSKPERESFPDPQDDRILTGTCEDGSRINVEIEWTGVVVNSEPLALATITDVTERTRTAMRLKLAVEVGHVGFWEYNLDDQTVRSSKKLLEQLGMKTPWSDIQDFENRLHPEDTVDAKQRIADYIESGCQGVYESVFRLRHNDGTYRWILSRGTAVVENGGQPNRMVGFHIDITDQHRTRLELERSNRDLDQFAYVASHDLKAPLRGIRHLTSWVCEDLGETMHDTTRRHLEMLDGQAIRMDKLLDDLLEYARVGREQADVEMLDLNQVVEDVFRFLTPPEILQLKISNQLPQLNSTRAPLEQILRNLIGNAINHAGEGNRQIEVSSTDLDHYYQFCVRDFGVGIPPQFQERVFQLFETLRPKNQAFGTGIGLAMVRRLAENAGGKAWVESDIGKGARFYFTWPKKSGQVG